MITNPTIFGAVTSFIDAGLGDVLAVDVITIINKKPENYYLIRHNMILSLKSSQNSNKVLVSLIEIQPVLLSSHQVTKYSPKKCLCLLNL